MGSHADKSIFSNSALRYLMATNNKPINREMGTGQKYRGYQLNLFCIAEELQASYIMSCIMYKNILPKELLHCCVVTLTASLTDHDASGIL